MRFLQVSAFALALAACGTSNQPPQTPASQPGEMGASVVSGAITFKGTPPPPRTLRTTSDPMCPAEGGVLPSEVLVVGAGGGLENVFVYVKDGLGNRTYPAPTAPVVLDQRRCQYVPHVFGIQVGQPLQIANSDPTLHNVHGVSKANREFNFGQPAGLPSVTRMFDKPEVMVPFRCDVHGWMNAYGGVVAHPFFAVSAADGRFEIKGLPAGTYTIEAWHEQLGTRTASITVDGKTPATLGFTFEPAA